MPRTSNFDLTVAKRLVARGASVREMAKIMQCSVGVVYANLHANGITIPRQRRGFKPDRKRALRIIDLHDRRGLSFDEIGRRMGRRSDPTTPMSRQSAQVEYRRAKEFLADEDIEDTE